MDDRKISPTRIFLRALGGVHPLEDGLHFFVADADAAFDLRLLQATPAVSPSIWRRSDRIDEPLALRYSVSWSAFIFTLCGDPLERRDRCPFGDLDFSGLGSLDLQGFIDQVAKHLLAKLVDWSAGNLAFHWRLPAARARWSMSVWVMTSPLTIAVALTTDGMAEPKIWGLSGRRSALALLRARSSLDRIPAPLLAVATAITSAAAPRIERGPG